MMKKPSLIINCSLFVAVVLAACGGSGQKTSEIEERALVAVTDFSADSAMLRVVEQCDFGARVPGSEAHKACGDYLVKQFESYGLQVTEQTFTAVAWNGDRLPLRNIIASLNPQAEMRILVSAHWDSRPWADNDPDEKNHHTPVIAANDGASGVAVMLEMARVLSQSQCQAGVDFICFDGEDYGVAQWADSDVDESWCLGSQYWAVQPHTGTYNALWGVNLDMVGGRGSVFMREGVSMHYAKAEVQRMWNVAAQLGYADLFRQEDGGYVTDDHVPVNQILGIPTVDIIPCYKDCEESSFGPTWHTVNDIPENIEPRVLKAVGDVVATMIINL